MSELASGLASTANAAPADSAPAPTPEPSSTPAAPSAPQSFADHLRAMEADPAPPETPTPPAPVGDAPTIAEPQKVEAPTGDAPKGPIPFDVHHTALKNAREKAAQEFQQQYGDAIQFATAFNADPVATVVHMVQQLQSHPEYGQALRSHAGRMLAAQRQQQRPQPEPEPEPDVVFRYADGTEGRTYSAEQLVKRDAWREKQIEQRIAERFAPLNDLQQKFTQAREIETKTKEYVQRNAPFAEQLKAMPGFSEHVQEIQAKQVELFRASPTSDPMALWFQAYREIVPAKLQQKQQAELATTALAKAAGRDANPAAVSPNPSPVPKSIHEAFAQLGLH